jgi:2-isopropylmalate synthase
VGIHAHNDCELAVANSLAAVEGGARQVQGTINGIGERCGNANLIALLPNLVLKQQYRAQSGAQLAELTQVSRQLNEIANLGHNPFAAYVGHSAFAHKGGLHAAAVQRLTASYEHIDPALVGNGREVLVSELSGRGNIRLRAEQLGLNIGDAESAITEEIKKAEASGLALEAADGSFELIVRRHDAQYSAPFAVRDLMVQSIRRTGETQKSLATAKVQVNGVETLTAAEASGPVAAIDQALRQALKPFYPAIEDVRLTDYKVRILDPESATAATTRVWLEASMGEHSWCTVGCSENIIEASAQALLDSLELCILRCRERGEHHGRINAA